jgi:hypothetical protein
VTCLKVLMVVVVVVVVEATLPLVHCMVVTVDPAVVHLMRIQQAETAVRARMKRW